MVKKNVKITIILAVLALSTIFPIVAVSFVSAKKESWTSGPVYINDAVPGHSWTDWSAQPWLKGSGTEADPYMIKDLVIDVSGSIFAMMIENSAVHFKIMGCTFRNGGIEGERTAGLILVGTTNGVVFKNTFNGNLGGLALIGTQYNLIQKNIFSENEIGIFLQWSMHDTLKQNDCKNNFGSGIMLSTAHKTIIEKNTCSGNGLAGILLINEQVDDPEGEHDPKDNIIYKNKLEDNQFGILFSRADINDIIYNTFSGNAYGVVLDSDCEGNKVYHNNFLDNGVQAWDNQPGINFFYHPYMLEGNYWKDYTGDDIDGNDIGDTPFGYDVYPLMEKDGWEFQTSEEEEILNAFFNNINRLGAGRTVNNSETSYIIYGVVQLFSERIEGEAYPPYTAYYAGIEAVDSVWLFWEDNSYGVPGLLCLLYIKIPPNYLHEVMGLPFGYLEFEVYLSWYNSGELIEFSFLTGFFLI